MKHYWCSLCIQCIYYGIFLCIFKCCTIVVEVCFHQIDNISLFVHVFAYSRIHIYSHRMHRSSVWQLSHFTLWWDLRGCSISKFMMHWSLWGGFWTDVIFIILCGIFFYFNCLASQSFHKIVRYNWNGSIIWHSFCCFKIVVITICINMNTLTPTHIQSKM